MRVLILALALAGCAQNTAEPGPYTAIDGDTIRTGQSPNIRLARIDAPELPGHCRGGRDCVQGNPYAAQVQLQAMLDEAVSRYGSITCETTEHDRYGRRIAECWPTGNPSYNFSSEMLRTGTVAIYGQDLSWQMEGAR